MTTSSAESVEQDASSAPSAPTPAAPAIADPGPLGLAGFAATTFVLSFVNAGLVPEGVEQAVLPLALFYGGLAQFMAGMWEFRKGNVFGATAFGTYGPFWMAFALFVWVFSKNIHDPAQAAVATGMFLLVFTIFTGYMTICSLRTTGALAAVFIFLFVTFLFLTIGEFGGATGIAQIGGWLGIITALLAWYASFAGVLQSTFKRAILPVFPLA